ncbi:MAG: hypothetical protein PQ612_05930 [Rickettsiales bacterium]|nr:hypothetical protein [Pseudomonadota bacterium]MDA0966862.1 hypothetical protein [Pseudomonadota bacterium]MDG4543537.1 hypothetical protein [Rickettsiales bacterium]MDG4545685.1 hypothetical protein [Rickettsiales bacterium]MDG4547542.1 hypothetical protein [Rickettsiales bacterium]
MSLIDFKRKKHRALDNIKCLQKKNKPGTERDLKKFLKSSLIDDRVFWQIVGTLNNRPYQPDFYHILITYNPDLRAHLNFVLHIKFGSRAVNIDSISDNIKFSSLIKKGHFVENANSVEDIAKILQTYEIPFVRG